MALVDLPLQETIVSWPLLLCTIRPMLGNLDSGIRKIFVCGIRNPEKFSLWNPAGILGFGIQKIAQENQNLTNDWNSESNSTDKDLTTWIPKQSAAWNAEFKTVLDFLILGKPLITQFSLFNVISIFCSKCSLTVIISVRSFFFSICANASDVTN